MNIRPLVLASLMLLLSAACSGPLGGESTTTAGVAKTTNGGVDWTLSNTVLTGQKGKGKNKDKEQTTSALANTDVLALHFDPKATEKLFAATATDGLYYSENSGEGWRQILSTVS